MPRAGNYDYAVFPYTYVKCKDGYTFISGFSDPNWSALCDIMDRPDLRERFPSIRERLTPENQPTIQHEIEKFTERYTADEIQDMIYGLQQKARQEGHGGHGAARKPPETCCSGNTGTIGSTFVRWNDPNYGDVLIQNSTFKSMSGTPGRVKWVCRPIGADNESVYRKYFGLDGQQLKELKENGIV